MYKWYFGNDSCGCGESDNNTTSKLQILEDRIKELEDKLEHAMNKQVTFSATASVYFQYLVYASLYGPPPDGVWDQDLLNQIYEEYKDQG